MRGARRLLLSVACALLAAPAPARGPERPGREEDEEKVRDAVRYVAPAPEMRKIRFLAGAWKSEEDWENPRRWKRPPYEGYPGPAGYATRTITEGPGGFSLVWSEEGRSPMGGHSSRSFLAWDPAGRAYVLDTIHSLFPGIRRLIGRLEKGVLVFRGEDTWTGVRRSLRVTWKDLSTKGWTEVVEASERGGPFRLVVTSRFRPAAGETSGRSQAP